MQRDEVHVCVMRYFLKEINMRKIELGFKDCGKILKPDQEK